MSHASERAPSRKDIEQAKAEVGEAFDTAKGEFHGLLDQFSSWLDRLDAVEPQLVALRNEIEGDASKHYLLKHIDEIITEIRGARK